LNKNTNEHARLRVTSSVRVRHKSVRHDFDIVHNFFAKVQFDIFSIP